MIERCVKCASEEEGEDILIKCPICQNAYCLECARDYIIESQDRAYSICLDCLEDELD